MRQIGMSDESIVRVFGYMPNLNMDPSDLTRLANEDGALKGRKAEVEVST